MRLLATRVEPVVAGGINLKCSSTGASSARSNVRLSIASGGKTMAHALAQIDVGFDDVLDWGVIALQRDPDFEHTPVDLTRTDRLLYHALRGHADVL